MAVHIRQPKIASLEKVGQFFVIESEQVQQRGVEVMDVDFVDLRFVAEIVGLPVDEARFAAAARKPNGEAGWAVVASGEGVVLAAAVFFHRSASEFGAANDEG